MNKFNEEYIWSLYNELCHTGSTFYRIPETNFRIKEVRAYSVKVQVELLHADKEGNFKCRWVDTGEKYEIDPYHEVEKFNKYFN